MTVYIYRDRYITNDEEIMSEKIQELVGMQHHSVSTVEAIAEHQWENVEEVQVNPQDIFRYMRKGYIFIDHIGVE